MKRTPTYIFIISLILGVQFSAYSQDEQDEEEIEANEAQIEKIDSVSYQERYGFRLGFDLSKPIRSFIDNDYQGLEITGDYRINENIFPAAEIGHESYEFEENYFRAKSEGQYIKLGANYNIYHNWIGMQNEITVGLRYGFTTFSQTLKDYTLNNRNDYFEPETRVPNEKSSGLSAHWIELQMGIKAEIVSNLYLGIQVGVKRLITSKGPLNYDILWMPGYNRNYDHTAFGMGWGYSISYLIPFSKKERKSKRD